MIIFLNKNKINQRVLIVSFVFIFVIFSIHGLLNLEKWQLVPIYFFGVYAFILFYAKSPKKWIKVALYILITLSSIFSLGLLYAFPIRDIPDPSGTYPIGTLKYTIEDEERLELYTDDPYDTRKFMITIWYPAANTNLYTYTKWMNDEVIADELAKNMGLPSIMLSQASEVLSNSFGFIPMSSEEDQYPVVIISHGWGGFMALHTDLAEELARRGYIVVGIDHTYGSVATSFIDETVYQNKEALPERGEPQFLEAAHQLVYTYAGDISKTLDFLEEENASLTNSFFKGKLDLDHIGLIGHSTGGGASVAVALDDPRITALLGLDAWVEPIDTIDINKGLQIPAIYLRSETWEEGPNNIHLYDLISRSNQSRLYQIEGTTHSDFTMAYMFSSLTGLIGITGSLDSNYLLLMQKDIMNSFFDEHLKGILDPSIDLTTYDELNLIDIT